MEKRSYSDLPEDVTSNILSRLPAKSVGQCRCVSKPWKELLYKLEFIKTHLQLSKIVPHESLAIYYNRRRPVFSASFSLSDKSAITTGRFPFPFTIGTDLWVPPVHGSCDGLVLIGDARQCVVNPVTKETHHVSPCDTTHMVCLGFGYDSVNHDYSQSQGPQYGFFPTKNPFVNGCIHWAVSRTEDTKKVAIIAFNAVEEELHELPCSSLDDGPTSGFYHTTFCAAGGCLWMFSPDKSKDKTEVWVMKQYGVQESWTKVGTTRIDAYSIRAVGLSSQDEMVLYERCNKSFIYNFKQGTLKGIAVDGTSERFMTVVSFIESLISPCNSEAW